MKKNWLHNMETKNRKEVQKFAFLWNINPPLLGVGLTRKILKVLMLLIHGMDVVKNKQKTTTNVMIMTF